MFGFSPISSVPISAIASALNTNSLYQYINCKISPAAIVTSLNSALKSSPSNIQLINTLLLGASSKNNTTSSQLIILQNKTLQTNSLIKSSPSNIQLINSLIKSSPSNIQLINTLLLGGFSKNNTTSSQLIVLQNKTLQTNSLINKTNQYYHKVDGLNLAAYSYHHISDSLLMTNVYSQFTTDIGLQASNNTNYFSDSYLEQTTFNLSHNVSGLSGKSLKQLLLSQMVLWRTIPGNSDNSFSSFHSESSGLYILSTPQNIDDVIIDNRKLLVKAGWGARDISPILSSQASIDISVPVRANGALFSVYDDRLPDIMLQDPVAVSYFKDFSSQKVLIGVKPTAKTRIKTFNAPTIEKSMQFSELPKKRKL